MSPRWLRRRLFGIASEEITLAKRGFLVRSASVGAHLERVGATFRQGYHAALEEDRSEALGRRLDEVTLQWRGFAYEGAAMGLMLRDRLTLAPFPRRRLRAFANAHGSDHIYMVHVGAGWVLGRLPVRLGPFLAGLDPLYGWLALDGYGFHEGYFHAPRSVAGQAVPARLTGYARRAFDQGLGRSLWFVLGAEVERIATTIAAFARLRHADLWSGVGLAAAYAGGREPEALEALRLASGGHAAAVAQGAAFAAKARQRAGNPAEHTEAACRVLCECSADLAAQVTDVALHGLPSEPADDGAAPAYEVWRSRIREQFAALCEAVP